MRGREWHGLGLGGDAIPKFLDEQDAFDGRKGAKLRFESRVHVGTKVSILGCECKRTANSVCQNRASLRQAKARASEFQWRADDFLVWDDCFCFPNLLVRVSRAYQITVTWQDVKGDMHTEQLEGPMAELIQHEIDHLDGILAVDRATGLDPFAFRREWEKLHDSAERHGPPTPREIL